MVSFCDKILLYKLLFSRGFYFRDFREPEADREIKDTRKYYHAIPYVQNDDRVPPRPAGQTQIARTVHALVVGLHALPVQYHWR